MWSSVQCGPDPLKASLQAIHQQQTLAEQSRPSIAAVGRGPFFHSTTASHPLLHQHSLVRQQPSQQRAAVPAWTTEYLHTQPPPTTVVFQPVPLHSAAVSSWLTEYSSFHHSRAAASSHDPSVAPLSLDDYSRTVAQRPLVSHTPHPVPVPSAAGHAHDRPFATARPPTTPTVASFAPSSQPYFHRPAASTPTWLPAPSPAIISAVPFSPAVAALHRPSTIDAAPFPFHSPQPVVAIANARQPSTLTSTHSSTTTVPPVASQLSTASNTSTAEADEYDTVVAARLHDALYGDEHELLDADFIDNGQWQHFKAPHDDTPLGISAHIVQLMNESGLHQQQPQQPQQRYIAEEMVAVAKGREERKDGAAAAAVQVGLLEYGSEWDASGRVWDWVVRGRQQEEEANHGQQSEGKLGMHVYETAASPIAAPAGASGVTGMGVDELLKEFYL